MAGKNKEVLINIRLKPETREEFRISAELRGASMSGLLHQFIVRTIREEKERDPKAFANLQGASPAEEIHSSEEHFDPQTHPAQNKLYKKFLRGEKSSPDLSNRSHSEVVDKGTTKSSESGKTGRNKND